MMKAFEMMAPEIAARETRQITVLDPKAHLPTGDYVFAESYCADAQCDCRNVMLNVMRVRPSLFQHVATINFSLDPGGFSDIGENDAFLDPLNHQTVLSKPLLELFGRTLARDPLFRERLEKHWAIAKEHARSSPPRRRLSTDEILAALRTPPPILSVQRSPESDKR
ncbi:MAG: hypothetical protein ACYDDF_12875 [Thermoplasmatota archaeon]